MSDQKTIDPIADLDLEAFGLPGAFQGDQPKPNDPPKGEEPEDPSKKEEPKGGEEPEDPDKKEDPAKGEDPDEPNGKEEPEDPDKKEEPKEDPDDPDDPEGAEPESTVVSELVEFVGFEDVDVENYDDSVEGLGNLVNDLSQKLANQRLSAQLEQNPDVKQYLEFINNGGDPDQYHQVRKRSADYESIELKEDDPGQHEQLVRDHLIQQDHDSEEIDNIVQKYKDAGILEDQAEIALKGLKRQAKKQKEQLLEQQDQLARQREKEIEQYWDNVKETLYNNNEFKGINIPTKERDSFFEYISTPVTEEGYTQRDLDAMEMGLEEKFAVDWLLFKGFPLDDMIDKKAATKSARSLKDRIKTGGDPKGRKGQQKRPTPKGSPDTIDHLDLM